MKIIENIDHFHHSISI